MSKTTSHDPLGRSRTEIEVEVTVAILICLTAVFGNLLVLYVVNRDSRLRNVTNLFIHHLALTDIVSATIDMPFWITSLYTGTWNFGQVWCQVAGSTFNFLGCASILMMGLIAFNRYMKVVKPTLYKKVFPNKKAAQMYCVLIWLVAVLMAITYLSGWAGIKFHMRLLICSSEHTAYGLASAGVIINGVMIMIFYCHFRIYKAVRQSTENLNAHAEGNGIRSLNDTGRFNITEIRVLNACFTVACFFVITYIPVYIIIVTWNFRFDVPQTVHIASIFLKFSGSMVNPFIYGIVNPLFKVAFKRALSFGRYGNSHPNQNLSRNRVAVVEMTGRNWTIFTHHN